MPIACIKSTTTLSKKKKCVKNWRKKTHCPKTVTITHLLSHSICFKLHHRLLPFKQSCNWLSQFQLQKWIIRFCSDRAALENPTKESDQWKLPVINANMLPGNFQDSHPAPIHEFSSTRRLLFSIKERISAHPHVLPLGLEPSQCPTLKV